MISSWTDHLKSDSEKEQYIKSVRHSKWILDDLSKLLIKIENGLDRQELSPRAYDEPNWAFRQAHANGFRQCLNKVQTLINLDQKELHDRQSIK